MGPVRLLQICRQVCKLSVWQIVLFYNLKQTYKRPHLQTVHVLVCFIHCHGNVLTEPLWCKCMLIPGQCLDFYQHIRCYDTRFSEPLSGNGLFHYNIVM
jgi:hypothetical protein